MTTINEGIGLTGVAESELSVVRRRKVHIAALTAIALFVVVAPLIIYPVFVMKLLCFAIFALAFNLLLGFGGLMSFGHAAFFGSGCYVAAYAARTFDLPPELSVLLGVVIAATIGFLLGILAIRRQGINFAMITLALSQLVYFLIFKLPQAGGESGIQRVPRGRFLGYFDLSNDMTLYIVLATVFLLSVLAMYRIVHSPFGQIMRATRDNEARVTSLGYQPSTYKLILFVLSAAFSGLAGGMKAILLQFATLADVHWTTSADPILMVLVGGTGTFFGPLVGAAVIVTMQDYLADLGDWVQVIQGLIFVFVVLVFRAGIVGAIAHKWRLPL